MQCHITENPDSKWEQLNPELNVRFVEVCEPHHALSLLQKARQDKCETLHIYAERLYTSAHDTRLNLNKAMVGS